MSSVPLTQAVTSGDARAVRAVIANGADVNERTGGGQTPLILATIFGHTHLIPLLLEAGADPHLRDNLGLNAIDWAQRRGATEAIGVLTGEANKTSPATFETNTPSHPARRARSLNVQGEKPRSVSEEERSRRWIEGLKQRIAEQSQSEVVDGPNIFRPQSEALRPSRLESPPPRPEIPSEPKPQPEIPAQPEPQPEIPAPSPDPQREIPSHPPEPEIPSPPAPEIPRVPTPEIPSPPTPEIPSVPSTPEISSRPREPGTEPHVETSVNRTESSVAETEAETPRRWSNRKRCPQCNAVYNSELVSYCAYHSVPLVDIDALPIISEPPKASPVLFWVIIAITLTGSIVLASMATKYFYNATTPQQTAASPPPAPVPVQKGTPTLGEELEGKAVSLPIAEAPLKGQEAIPGTVVVRVVIAKSGQVKAVEASGGDWLLRGAAAEAAMKSTFAPARLRGRETEGTITYTFEP